MKLLLRLVILSSILLGGVGWLAQDIDGLRAFVAVARASITGSPDDICCQPEPPPVFGDAPQVAKPTVTGVGQGSIYNSARTTLEAIFGAEERDENRPVRITRGGREDSVKGGMAEQIFGNRDKGTGFRQITAPQPPDASEPDAARPPRDFTDRGRHASPMRRITVGN